MSATIAGMELPAVPRPHAPTRIWLLLSGGTALVVLAVYAFMFYGSFFIESNPLKNQFDVVYSKASADGTVAWYDYEKGRLTEHPAPAPGNVIGLTRSSAGTYMAVQPSIIATDSSIYTYKDGSYSLVYKDAEHLLFGLSVSKDDAYIGFVAASKDGRTMSVYDVAQKVRTDLGPGSVAPQFLTVQGKTAFVYTQGMHLVMRSKNGDAWSEPQILFTSMQLSISQFATNGVDR